MQNFFTVLCLLKLWHVTIFLKWKIINSEIKDNQLGTSCYVVDFMFGSVIIIIF